MTHRLNQYNIMDGPAPAAYPEVIHVNNAATRIQKPPLGALNIREKLKKKAEEKAEKHKANQERQLNQNDDDDVSGVTNFPITEINAWHKKESVSDLDNSIRNFPVINIMEGGTIANVSDLDPGPTRRHDNVEDDADNDEDGDEEDKYAATEGGVTGKAENQFVYHHDIEQDGEDGDGEARAALADSITEWSIQEIESEDTGAVAVEVMLSACNQTRLGQMFLKNVPMSLQKNKKDGVQTVLKRINEQGQKIVVKMPKSKGNTAAKNSQAKQGGAQGTRKKQDPRSKIVEETPRVSNTGKGQFSRTTSASSSNGADIDKYARKKSRNPKNEPDFDQGSDASSIDASQRLPSKRLPPDAPSRHPGKEEEEEEEEEEDPSVRQMKSARDEGDVDTKASGNRTALRALARALNAELNEHSSSSREELSDEAFLSEAENFEQFVSAGVNIEELLGLEKVSEDRSDSVSSEDKYAAREGEVINLVDASEDVSEEELDDGRKLLMEAKKLVMKSQISENEKRDLLETLAKFGQERLSLNPSARLELVRSLSNISEDIIPELIDLTGFADSFGMDVVIEGDNEDETTTKISEGESTTNKSIGNSLEELKKFAVQQVVEQDIPKNPVKSHDSLETLMDLAAQLLRMKGDQEGGALSQEENSSSSRSAENQQKNKEEDLVIVQGVSVPSWGVTSQTSDDSSVEERQLAAKQDPKSLSEATLNKMLEEVMKQAGEDTLDTVLQATGAFAFGSGTEERPQPTSSSTRKMIEEIQKEIAALQSKEGQQQQSGLKASSSMSSFRASQNGQVEIDLDNIEEQKNRSGHGGGLCAMTAGFCGHDHQTLPSGNNGGHVLLKNGSSSISSDMLNQDHRALVPVNAPPKDPLSCLGQTTESMLCGKMDQEEYLKNIDHVIIANKKFEQRNAITADIELLEGSTCGTEKTPSVSGKTSSVDGRISVGSHYYRRVDSDSRTQGFEVTNSVAQRLRGDLQHQASSVTPSLPSWSRSSDDMSGTNESAQLGDLGKDTIESFISEHLDADSVSLASQLSKDIEIVDTLVVSPKPKRIARKAPIPDDMNRQRIAKPSPRAVRPKPQPEKLLNVPKILREAPLQNVPKIITEAPLLNVPKIITETPPIINTPTQARDPIGSSSPEDPPEQDALLDDEPKETTETSTTGIEESVTKNDTAVFAAIMRAAQKDRGGLEPDAPKCGLDDVRHMTIAFDSVSKADSEIASRMTQSVSGSTGGSSSPSSSNSNSMVVSDGSAGSKSSAATEDEEYAQTYGPFAANGDGQDGPPSVQDLPSVQDEPPSGDEQEEESNSLAESEASKYFIPAIPSLHNENVIDDDGDDDGDDEEEEEEEEESQFNKREPIGERGSSLGQAYSALADYVESFGEQESSLGQVSSAFAEHVASFAYNKTTSFAHAEKEEVNTYRSTSPGGSPMPFSGPDTAVEHAESFGYNKTISFTDAEKEEYRSIVSRENPVPLSDPDNLSRRSDKSSTGSESSGVVSTSTPFLKSPAFIDLSASIYDLNGSDGEQSRNLHKSDEIETDRSKSSERVLTVTLNKSFDKSSDESIGEPSEGSRVAEASQNLYHSIHNVNKSQSIETDRSKSSDGSIGPLQGSRIAGSSQNQYQSEDIDSDRTKSSDVSVGEPSMELHKAVILQASSGGTGFGHSRASSDAEGILQASSGGTGFGGSQASSDAAGIRQASSGGTGFGSSRVSSDAAGILQASSGGTGFGSSRVSSYATSTPAEGDFHVSMGSSDATSTPAEGASVGTGTAKHDPNIVSASTSMSIQHDIYSYDFKKNSLLESKDTFDFKRNSILESKDTYDLKKNSILESKDTDPDGLRNNSLLTNRSVAVGSIGLNIPSDVEEDGEDHIEGFHVPHVPDEEPLIEGVSDADFREREEIVFCDGSAESDYNYDENENDNHLPRSGRHSVVSCPDIHHSMDGASLDAIEYTSAPTEVFGDHGDQSTIASVSEGYSTSHRSSDHVMRPAPSAGEEQESSKQGPPATNSFLESRQAGYRSVPPNERKPVSPKERTVSPKDRKPISPKERPVSPKEGRPASPVSPRSTPSIKRQVSPTHRPVSPLSPHSVGPIQGVRSTSSTHPIHVVDSMMAASRPTSPKSPHSVGQMQVVRSTSSTHPIHVVDSMMAAEDPDKSPTTRSSSRHIPSSSRSFSEAKYAIQVIDSMMAGSKVLSECGSGYHHQSDSGSVYQSYSGSFSKDENGNESESFSNENQSESGSKDEHENQSETFSKDKNENQSERISKEEAENETDVRHSEGTIQEEEYLKAAPTAETSDMTLGGSIASAEMLRKLTGLKAAPTTETSDSAEMSRKLMGLKGALTGETLDMTIGGSITSAGVSKKTLPSDAHQSKLQQQQIPHIDTQSFQSRSHEEAEKSNNPSSLHTASTIQSQKSYQCVVSKGSDDDNSLQASSTIKSQKSSRTMQSRNSKHHVVTKGSDDDDSLQAASTIKSQRSSRTIQSQRSNPHVATKGSYDDDSLHAASTIKSKRSSRTIQSQRSNPHVATKGSYDDDSLHASSTIKSQRSSRSVPSSYQGDKVRQVSSQLSPLPSPKIEQLASLGSLKSSRSVLSSYQDDKDTQASSHPSPPTSPKIDRLASLGSTLSRGDASESSVSNKRGDGNEGGNDSDRKGNNSSPELDAEKLEIFTITEWLDLENEGTEVYLKKEEEILSDTESLSGDTSHGSKDSDDSMIKVIEPVDYNLAVNEAAIIVAKKESQEKKLYRPESLDRIFTSHLAVEIQEAKKQQLAKLDLQRRGGCGMLCMVPFSSSLANAPAFKALENAPSNFPADMKQPSEGRQSESDEQADALSLVLSKSSKDDSILGHLDEERAGGDPTEGFCRGAAGACLGNNLKALEAGYGAQVQNNRTSEQSATSDLYFKELPARSEVEATTEAAAEDNNLPTGAMTREQELELLKEMRLKTVISESSLSQCSSMNSLARASTTNDATVLSNMASLSNIASIIEENESDVSSPYPNETFSGSKTDLSPTSLTGSDSARNSMSATALSADRSKEGPVQQQNMQNTKSMLSEYHNMSRKGRGREERDEEDFAFPPPHHASFLSMSNSLLDVPGDSRGEANKAEASTEQSSFASRRTHSVVPSGSYPASNQQSSVASQGTRSPINSDGYISDNCGSTLPTQRDDPFISYNMTLNMNDEDEEKWGMHKHDSTEEVVLTAPPVTASSFVDQSDGPSQSCRASGASKSTHSKASTKQQPPSDTENLRRDEASKASSLSKSTAQLTSRSNDHAEKQDPSGSKDNSRPGDTSMSPRSQRQSRSQGHEGSNGTHASSAPSKHSTRLDAANSTRSDHEKGELVVETVSSRGSNTSGRALEAEGGASGSSSPSKVSKGNDNKSLPSKTSITLASSFNQHGRQSKDEGSVQSLPSMKPAPSGSSNSNGRWKPQSSDNASVPSKSNGNGKHTQQGSVGASVPASPSLSSRDIGNGSLWAKQSEQIAPGDNDHGRQGVDGEGSVQSLPSMKPALSGISDPSGRRLQEVNVGASIPASPSLPSRGNDKQGLLGGSLHSLPSMKPAPSGISDPIGRRMEPGGHVGASIPASSSLPSRGKDNQPQNEQLVSSFSVIRGLEADEEEADNGSIGSLPSVKPAPSNASDGSQEAGIGASPQSNSSTDHVNSLSQPNKNVHLASSFAEFGSEDRQSPRPTTNVQAASSFAEFGRQDLASEAERGGASVPSLPSNHSITHESAPSQSKHDIKLASSFASYGKRQEDSDAASQNKHSMRLVSSFAGYSYSDARREMAHVTTIMSKQSAKETTNHNTGPLVENKITTTESMKSVYSKATAKSMPNSRNEGKVEQAGYASDRSLESKSLDTKFNDLLIKHRSNKIPQSKVAATDKSPTIHPCSSDGSDDSQGLILSMTRSDNDRSESDNAYNGGSEDENTSDFSTGALQNSVSKDEGLNALQPHADGYSFDADNTRMGSNLRSEESGDSADNDLASEHGAASEEHLSRMVENVMNRSSPYDGARLTPMGYLGDSRAVTPAVPTPMGYLGDSRAVTPAVPKTDQFPTRLSTKELIKLYTESGSVDSREENYPRAAITTPRSDTFRSGNISDSDGGSRSAVSAPMYYRPTIPSDTAAHASLPANFQKAAQSEGTTISNPNIIYVGSGISKGSFSKAETTALPNLDSGARVAMDIHPPVKHNLSGGSGSSIMSNTTMTNAGSGAETSSSVERRPQHRFLDNADGRSVATAPGYTKTHLQQPGDSGDARSAVSAPIYAGKNTNYQQATTSAPVSATGARDSPIVVSQTNPDARSVSTAPENTNKYQGLSNGNGDARSTVSAPAHGGHSANYPQPSAFSAPVSTPGARNSPIMVSQGSADAKSINADARSAVSAPVKRIEEVHQNRTDTRSPASAPAATKTSHSRASVVNMRDDDDSISGDSDNILLFNAPSLEQKESYNDDQKYAANFDYQTNTMEDQPHLPTLGHSSFASETGPSNGVLAGNDSNHSMNDQPRLPMPGRGYAVSENAQVKTGPSNITEAGFSHDAKGPGYSNDGLGGLDTASTAGASLANGARGEAKQPIRLYNETDVVENGDDMYRKSMHRSYSRPGPAGTDYADLHFSPQPQGDDDDASQVGSSSANDSNSSHQSKSTEELLNDAAIRNLALTIGGDDSATRDFVTQIINDESIQRFASNANSSSVCSDDNDMHMHEALSLCYSPNDEEEDNASSDVDESTSARPVIQNYASSSASSVHNPVPRPDSRFDEMHPSLAQRSHNDEAVIQIQSDDQSPKVYDVDGDDTSRFEVKQMHAATTFIQIQSGDQSPKVYDVEADDTSRFEVKQMHAATTFLSKQTMGEAILHIQGGDHSNKAYNDDALIHIESTDRSSKAYNDDTEDTSTMQGVVHILSEDSTSRYNVENPESPAKYTNDSSTRAVATAGSARVPESVTLGSSFVNRAVHQPDAPYLPAMDMRHHQADVQQDDTQEDSDEDDAVVESDTNDSETHTTDESDSGEVLISDTDTTSGDDTIAISELIAQFDDVTLTNENGRLQVAVMSDNASIQSNSDFLKALQDLKRQRTGLSSHPGPPSPKHSTVISPNSSAVISPNPSNIQRPVTIDEIMRNRKSELSPGSYASRPDSEHLLDEDSVSVGSLSQNSKGAISVKSSYSYSYASAQHRGTEAAPRHGSLTSGVLSGETSVSAEYRVPAAMSPHDSASGGASVGYKGGRSVPDCDSGVSQHDSASAGASSGYRGGGPVQGYDSGASGILSSEVSGNIAGIPTDDSKRPPSTRRIPIRRDEDYMPAGRPRLPIRRYDSSNSGIVSVDTNGNSTVVTSVEQNDAIEIQESSSAVDSVATHASQKARELRAQLDQALKTSAAIRSTQERLGAELSTFKRRLDKQRESNSSVSPSYAESRSRATSPSSSFRDRHTQREEEHLAYRGRQHHQSTSSYLSAASDDVSSVRLNSGSQGFASVPSSVGQSQPSRRGSSESPRGRRYRSRNVSLATARRVAESARRAMSTGRAGMRDGRGSHTVGASSIYSSSIGNASSSYSHYESSRAASSSFRGRSREVPADDASYYSEGNNTAVTSSTAGDIVLNTIQKQELEERKRREQLQQFARQTYNLMEDNAIVDLTQALSDDVPSPPPPRRRGMFF